MYHTDMTHTIIYKSYTKNYSSEFALQNIQKNNFVIHEFKNN